MLLEISAYKDSFQCNFVLPDAILELYLDMTKIWTPRCQVTNKLYGKPVSNQDLAPLTLRKTSELSIDLRSGTGGFEVLVSARFRQAPAALTLKAEERCRSRLFSMLWLCLHFKPRVKS